MKEVVEGSRHLVRGDFGCKSGLLGVYLSVFSACLFDGEGSLEV